MRSTIVFFHVQRSPVVLSWITNQRNSLSGNTVFVWRERYEGETSSWELSVEFGIGTTVSNHVIQQEEIALCTGSRKWPLEIWIGRDRPTSGEGR